MISIEAQKDVGIIRRCIARLNDIEQRQKKINGLSLRSYSTIREYEELSRQERQTLVALENAWYGSDNPERYKREL
jgi:hypothetical protein